MIIPKILLELHPTLRVGFADGTDSQLTANLFDARVDDGEDDNGHVAPKHKDNEVAKLEVGVHADDVERGEDVAREECQYLIGHCHLALAPLPDREKHVR